MTAVIMLILVVLLFAGVPIAQALGMESMIYLMHENVSLNIIPQKFFAGIDSFTMLAIPGFMLAGNLMNNGGITERIVDFCKRICGRMRGSLGVANVVASMIFGGISGSAVGDTASIGGILIPAMKKDGYSADYSVGVTAASSCLAPIIPPSIPMIVLAGCTSLSVGKLFVGGIIPGIMLGLGQVLLALFLAYRYKHPRGIKCTVRELFISVKDAFFALLMVVIILFGILSGKFTPTEASIIAVVYGWFVGTFIYKELHLKDLPKIVLDSTLQATAVLAITGFATGFAWILTSNQIPTKLATVLTSVSTNKIVILLLINLLLVFVGCFMETLSALLILMPVLLPIATMIGMDPLQFGLMCVINLVLGLCTPPVGVCLATACSIGDISLSEGVKGILPFYAIGLGVLILVAAVPGVTTFLPSLLY